MPRKGKRSESQKQRRKLQSSLGTSNSTNSVSGMSEENPYVLSVKASHCQTDARYSVYSRGRQCTCNSLMFLAVHNERNELQSFDLDGILEKGDAVYTSVKRALQSKGKFVGNFLNFDELPNTIETNSRCYNILKHPQRFGFLRDTPALGNYENLENTLQCLRADVSDALLLCGGSCIAVFRDRSGRFGYFDSHCRSVYGIPVEEGTGTAVFLTFHQLQDLVDRLLILYQGCFDLRDQEEFELLPVSFINMMTESCVRTEVSLNCCDLEHDVQPSVSFENKALSNNEQCLSADVPQQYIQVQDTVQQLSETAVNRATSTDEQAHLTEVSPICCDLELNVQPSFTFEKKDLSNDGQCSSTDVLQHVQVQDPVQQLSETAVNRATSTDEQAHLIYQDKMEVQTTVTQNRDKYKNVSLSEPSHNLLSQDPFELLASNQQNSQFTVKQIEKLNKTQKRRSYCKKWHKKMVQRQGVYDLKQAVRDVYDYKTSSEYRQRHNQAMMNDYWNKMTYREKHKQAMRNNYKNNEKYRGNKKSKITINYKNDEQYRERQKNYIVQNYRNREQFRERQKNYLIQNYRNREQFRERQKNYLIQNYRNREQFRERQKNYIIQNYRDNVKHKEQLKQNLVDRYLKDAIFRQRQKDHYTNRCKRDPNYYKRRKEIFKQHYHCDAHFRARQKEYYLFKSKNKTSALKVLHKVHCAQEIQYKYKKMYLMHRQRETLQDSQHDIVQDPGMLRALNVFRDVIKQGPTYVCTCCARALFSNQVRNCEAPKYKQNPTVAALCLTGNYVHICSDCPDRCALEDMKTEWICHSCHTTLLRGVMPDIAVANMLQFTPIPPELSDLNILERHVIAKYIPFAKILTLPKGQQRAIKGAVISVASEVETTVNCLPRSRSESQLLTVKLKRRLCYQGHYQFQTLSMRKVLSALRKLKEMHSEYKDIIINAALSEEEMFNEHERSANDISAPDEEMDVESSSQNENTEEQSNENQHNDSSENPETTAEEQSRGLALDTCLQPPDLGQQLLSYDDGIFCIAPASKNSPVSIFKVKKLESMSFPVQFPDGKNTFDEPDRAKHVSPSRYFNTRLFSIDNRCARDTNYIFFAQFVTEMHMATSSMSIQLRKAKPMTRDGRRINCSLLQDKQELEKLVNNKEATRFMQPLRGTPAYWEKTMRDLFAMLRQLGTPTFFCTFSAAEMRWPEVITAIKAQQGETVNFDELDWSEKCEILRSNPVTAMRMFEKRVEALMRDLIMSPARPIGEVIDFFYRVEFQLRGSPHIHCLFWVKDAPEFENDEDQDVCDFIDKYISCKLPDPNKDPELHRIVSEVQMHSRNHSKSCRKNKKHCRFGFPKPPINRTTITRPRPPPAEQSDDENGSEERDYASVAKERLQKVWDLLNDSNQSFETITQLLNQANMTYEEYEKHIEALSTSSLIVMERRPQDCWVNGYNPMLLRAWNANMDIQFILNPYSCIMYMLSYISKSEHEMSDYLKRVIKDSSHDNLSDRECMKQVMNAYSKNREVSAQEAVARTCSLKLKSSSRSVIFIPTDDNAVKMSLPMRYLQTMDDDVENVWMTGLPDKYKARPNRPEFENMCMAEFASEYRIVYGGQTKGKNVLPLQKNMGHIQKRTRGKPAVIRFARFSQEKHPEKFYGTLLKLYLPYRRDEQLKSTRFPTYESFYAFASVKLPGTDELQRVFDIVNENRKKYEKHNEAIEKAIEDFEQNGPIEDAWTTLAPANELIRLESIMEREPTDPNEVNEQEDIPEYTASTSISNTAMPLMEAAQLNHAQIRKMYQSLNQTQASIFYAVRDWCKRCVSGESPQPFLYFLNGGAGVGKSHVIKSIYAEASKILRRLPCMREHTDISQPTVLLTAFTGTAAFNISGKTLHCLLKLPRSLKPPYQGLGNSLDEMRADLSNARILIIDEISMVSKQLFAYVNWRLQQIKGNQKHFGGLSILAVGDFFQLPPLGRAKPLCVYEDHVLDFWKNHFQMITLTQIMRQRDDLAYAELLNRLRVKQKHAKLADADKCMLEVVIRSSPEECPIDALHIYATNKEVDSHNTEAISSRFSDIINLDAHDYKKDPRTGEMRRQAVPLKGDKRDLIDTLQIAIGAQVMLTRNIDVEDGLVNGTFGNVAKITAQTRGGVPVVQSIGLHLDNVTAGQKHRNKAPNGDDNIVYIERSEEPLKKKGTVRRQFPMKLAFACTIHKVQGMTTDCAVVSLKHIFESGMAYVALSRTTTLSGLHITDFDEKKIFCNPEISASLENMTKADFQNIQPILHIVQDSKMNSALKIIHHNTEGLECHLDDLKCHHELLLADVLCLTETHLSGSAVPAYLQLDGYTMYRRNRHASYTNYIHLANKSGGGVAIYVKNSFQVSPLMYIQNVTDLEYLVLKIKAPKQALLAVIYRPPSYNLADFLANLNALLTSLEIMDFKPIIVCGDFNEDQLSHCNKPILNLFEDKGYTQLISTGTTENNTLLDPVFVSGAHANVRAGVLQSYYSYHDPVYCVLE
uniref:ATP-dependent DNA helicase n=1 Tax=Cyprinus carpio TaxID=7962 RepID=A0A8C1LAF7_CYPCA